MGPAAALFDILNSQMGAISVSILLFFVFVIFLRNMTVGMALLIFSIPLSPEITGIFGPEIPIRIDDILIIMLFGAWVMRFGKGESRFYRSPFNLPVIALFTFMIVTTIIGYAYKQTITHPKYSILVLLKNFEYYAVFFLAANNILTRKQVRFSLILWMAAYLIVIIYGMAEHLIWSPIRVYENGYYLGQSNHMGGYLMISTTIAIALLFAAKTRKIKLACFALIMPAFYLLLINMSKQSYLSFTVSIFLVFLILKPRLLFIPIAAIFIMFVFIPQAFPKTMVSKSLTITKEDTFKLGVHGDEATMTSADVRRRTILKAFQRFPQHPFIGCGVGYRGLSWYDSQIPLLLYEGGMIGTGIFLWMISRLFLNGFRIFSNSKDAYFKAISASFLASLCGVLVQSVASTAWMVTLIAEPFWFFAGLIIAMDRINRKEMIPNFR